MSDDSTQTDSAPVELSLELEKFVPSGTEIYDALMGGIEPELVSANMALLEEKYKNETAEEKEVRQERYQKAFEAYDKAYKEWISDLSAAVEAKKKDAYKVAEEQTKNADEAVLGDIESQFENAGSSSL
jgi:hypothetical protein